MTRRKQCAWPTTPTTGWPQACGAPNNARALAIAERIQAGSVWINDAHQINCQLPFGGYKQRGLGRELGPDTLDVYIEVKTVALDLPGGRATKPYDLLLSHADG